MERIKRALELARIQRDRPEFVHEAATVPDERPSPPERPLQGWHTPVVPVDPVQLANERILIAGQPGPASGQYRLLRTQVMRRLEQWGANTLAVISPRANEGKTLTAINLAITLAADPNRTALLVDLDLRRPSVASRFGIIPETGIEDCLQGRAPVEQALVRPRGYDRLTLLPARAADESAFELLGTARMGELVAELRTRYTNRVVVFDLPPVLEADDVLAFARHMQAALLVISEGRTRREDVSRSLQLLGEVPVVGTLLNASRTSRPGGGY